MCICRELCSLAPCRGTSVAKQTRKETKEETNKPEDKQRNKKQETRKESTSKETMKKQGNNGIVNREQETKKQRNIHRHTVNKEVLDRTGRFPHELRITQLYQAKMEGEPSTDRVRFWTAASTRYFADHHMYIQKV